MTTASNAQGLPNLPARPRNRQLGVAVQELVLLAVLVLAVTWLAWRAPNFWTAGNILNQFRLMTEVGLVALPMTFIIITGGIDLSVGSIFGLAAIMLGYAWNNWGLPLPVAVGVALLTGTLAGAVNGWFIVRVRVPPLIMTLATLALFRGLAEGISQGRSVRGYPTWFYQLGTGQFMGLPSQVWVLLVAALLAAVVLHRTTFGRTLYAIGSNAVSARFSGLAVGRTLLMSYIFSGFMAALAGYIFVSRVSTTRSDMGTGLELDVIAAVVLGGTDIFGGRGSIFGTMMGVVLIQLLKNGMALSGVTGDATVVVIGSVLIGAILVNNGVQALLAARERRAQRKLAAKTKVTAS